MVFGVPVNLISNRDYHDDKGIQILLSETRVVSRGVLACMGAKVERTAGTW